MKVEVKLEIRTLTRKGPELWPILFGLAWMVGILFLILLQFNRPRFDFEYAPHDLTSATVYSSPFGFYPVEQDEAGNSYMWTDGLFGFNYNAKLNSAVKLVFSLRSAAVSGGVDAPLVVKLNNVVVGSLQPDPHTRTFQPFTLEAIPPQGSNQNALIEVQAQTFVPDNGDTRALGTMVNRIEVHQEAARQNFNLALNLLRLAVGLVLLLAALVWLGRQHRLARFGALALSLVGLIISGLSLLLMLTTKLLDTTTNPLWFSAGTYLTLLWGLMALGLFLSNLGVYAPHFWPLQKDFSNPVAYEDEPLWLEQWRKNWLAASLLFPGLPGLFLIGLLLNLFPTATLLLGLVVFNLGLCGYLLAFCFMKDENRLVIMLPFGLLGSTCLYGYGSIVNQYLLNLDISIAVANVELLAFCLVINWKQRVTLLNFRPELGFRIKSNNIEPLIWIGVLLLTLGGLTWFNWDNYVTRQTITEARAWHEGLSSSLARGNFPPVNILEPDYPLVYRWTYHSQNAALIRLLGIDPSVATGAFNVWLMEVLFGGLLALLYRQGYTLVEATWGSALFLFANTFSWLLNWPLTAINAYFRRNYLTGGSLFDMLEVNPSTIFGYFVLVAVLWFWLEWQGKGFSKTGFVILAILIAYLNGSSEVFIVLFGLALGLYWLVLMAVDRVLYFKPLALTVALGALTFIFSLPLSTLVTTMLLDSNRVKGFSLTFNQDHLGSIPSTPANSTWVPVFNWQFLAQSGLIPLLLLVLLVGRWRAGHYASRSPLVWMLILLGLGSFAFSTLAYPVKFPWDQYRFNQAWFALLGLGAYLGLVRLTNHIGPVIRRLLKVGLLIVVIGWMIPGIYAGFARATTTIGTACVNEDDRQAALYFADISWKEVSRVVVVNGLTDWLSFYKPCNAALLSNTTLFQYGGISQPMGHTIYDHIGEYQADYRKAAQELDLAALHKLKIDYLYVNPVIVKPELKTKLADLEKQGIIKATYNINNRLIYKVNQSIITGSSGTG